MAISKQDLQEAKVGDTITTGSGEEWLVVSYTVGAKLADLIVMLYVHGKGYLDILFDDEQRAIVDMTFGMPLVDFNHEDAQIFHH